MKAPFPWMGGKLSVSDVVWNRFGKVRNYVEPFAGSLAVLLNRPTPFDGPETVNDLNGWLANFWRALQADPSGVAKAADWPVSELDLHARGDWLFYRPQVDDFVERMRSDPDYYCVKSAGWWVWGQCAWIGTGWGPRKLPHLGDAGRGVNRKRPHLGNAGRGVNRQRPALQIGAEGRCLKSDRVKKQGLLEYMNQLAERLRCVRVCCGDWSRVCGPTPTVKQGLTAVFLDPPYGVEDRADCYDATEDRKVSAKAREWCLEWQDDPRMRIALCGYEGEHEMPDSWECYAWKARGGYGSQSENGNDNPHRERIWFSPHCLKEDSLFSE